MWLMPLDGDHREGRVGAILRHRSERRGAEDHPCGLVAGPAEGGEWEHETTVPQVAGAARPSASQRPSAPRNSRIRSARNDDAVRPCGEHDVVGRVQEQRERHACPTWPPRRSG